MSISMRRVIGARGVVGVQGREHEVAGERRLDRDLRRLVVTDLTDEHDVGVGSQDRAQRAREGQARLRVDLHLVDAGHAVLDRVLDRDDVDLGPRDRVEGRVERRRLSRSGRARDEDHAVRLACTSARSTPGSCARACPGRSMSSVVAELSRIRMTTFSPHTVGSVATRRSICAAAVHDRHATVLRLAALGDVDVAHDLEARDDAVLDALGRALHLVQHAVDAVAHAQSSCSPGSMWMSDARSWIAWLMSRLTKRTIGASSSALRDRYDASASPRPLSSSSAVVRSLELAVGAEEAVDRGARGPTRSATTTSTRLRVVARTSSSAKTSPGSTIARVSGSPLDVRSGSTLVAAAHRGGHERDARCGRPGSRELDERSPTWAARAEAI